MMVGQQRDGNCVQHALNEPKNTDLGTRHLSQKLHSNAISEYFFWFGQRRSELGYGDSMEGWRTSRCLLQVLGTCLFSVIVLVPEPAPAVIFTSPFQAGDIFVGASVSTLPPTISTEEGNES